MATKIRAVASFTTAQLDKLTGRDQEQQKEKEKQNEQQVHDQREGAPSK